MNPREASWVSCVTKAEEEGMHVEERCSCLERAHSTGVREFKIWLLKCAGSPNERAADTRGSGGRIGTATGQHL